MPEPGSTLRDTLKGEVLTDPQSLATAPSADGDWRSAARGSRLGRLLVVVLTAAAVVGGVWWNGQRGGTDPAAPASAPVTVGGAPGAATGSAPVVGQPLADFSAVDISGRTISLSALRGRPVWLSFGATWCGPCRVEAPDMQAAYEASRSRPGIGPGAGTTAGPQTGSTPGPSTDRPGLEIVAVYLGEDAATVRDATQRLGLSYVHVPDPANRVAAGYRVLGIPTHVFVDRSGMVRAVVVGVLGAEQIQARIAEISTP